MHPSASSPPAAGLYAWGLTLRAQLSATFSGPEAAAHVTTLLIVLLLCCAVPLAAPATFCRHRGAVLGLARLAFTLQPDFCSERSIVTVLDAASGRPPVLRCLPCAQPSAKGPPSCMLVTA